MNNPLEHHADAPASELSISVNSRSTSTSDAVNTVMPARDSCVDFCSQFVDPAAQVQVEELAPLASTIDQTTGTDASITSSGDDKATSPSDVQAAVALAFNADPEAGTTTQYSSTTEIALTYGGYRFSNPEQDCEKILNWFINHFALSTEQAVHELKVGNLSARMTDLRKRGYQIHSVRHLAEVTSTHKYFSMVYALHRDMGPVEKMPYWMRVAVCIETANALLNHRPMLLDLHLTADSVGDIRTRNALFRKIKAMYLEVAPPAE